ncbi:unnamed protein product, partial [Ixodes hexagonus]
QSEFVSSGYYVQQRPWTPTKRRGPIASDFKTPGPGSFTIPSTIGHQSSTNVTKGSKAPSYTFGAKIEEKKDLFVPGPGTYNIAGISEKGKETVPAPFIGAKIKEPEGFKTPAPGAYNPEKADSVLNAAPSYTFGAKIKDPKPADIPGFDHQSQGETRRPLIIRNRRAPRFSFGLKLKSLFRPNDNPAPGTYDVEKSQPVVYPKSPSFSIRRKFHDPSPDVSPAPGDYRPENADETIYPKSPSYSIRRKFKSTVPESFQYPAPDAYSPERCQGALAKSPKYSFGSKLRDKEPDHFEFPAPGTYNIERSERVTFSKAPEISMGCKLNGAAPEGSEFPGPATYNARTNEDGPFTKPPSYSIGQRLHSPHRESFPGLYANLSPTHIHPKRTNPCTPPSQFRR